MRGYLSVSGADSGQVEIQSLAEVYRDPGDTQEIILEKENGATIPLGIADVTVSRKKNGQAPVLINPQSDFVEVHNKGNSNGVTIIEHKQGEKYEVDEGYLERVRHDATISIGFNADLRLAVKSEAKVEKKYINRGEGDMVVGEQKNVDKSTSIGDDNIINRSGIGGEDGGDLGDDNVVNRSSVGKGNQKEASASQGTNPQEKRMETQYCIKCGTEISATAASCPACGASLDGITTGDDSESETRSFCERHQQTYLGDVCPQCAGERN